MLSSTASPPAAVNAASPSLSSSAIAPRARCVATRMSARPPPDTPRPGGSHELHRCRRHARLRRGARPSEGTPVLCLHTAGQSGGALAAGAGGPHAEPGGAAGVVRRGWRGSRCPRPCTSSTRCRPPRAPTAPRSAPRRCENGPQQHAERARGVATELAVADHLDVPALGGQGSLRHGPIASARRAGRCQTAGPASRTCTPRRSSGCRVGSGPLRSPRA